MIQNQHEYYKKHFEEHLIGMSNSVDIELKYFYLGECASINQMLWLMDKISDGEYLINKNIIRETCKKVGITCLI